MDMALDDIIMQERGDKQKSKRQLARERLASKKAEAKARRSSGGPQRSRELGRIEIREQAKPYAGKSTPGTVSFTANCNKSHPPRTRKYRPTTTIFSVFNPDAVAAEQAAKAKPTSSTTARNTNTAASSRNHHVANTSSPRPMPMAPTKVRSSSPPPPPAPKRAISILGEGGPATILVENLHPGATPEDIKTVFARFGPVKNCTAFYDQHGRSTGRAEICYALKIQALSAIKALNNVEADGKQFVAITQSID
ncbi:hypothetical protein BDF19DRAFT_428798 [Syncephalis fuscata]|nr:hypothetical protein BDF19DRAFT_428798 [Syncephalis fuscata]